MGIGQGGFLVPGAVKIEPRQILAYSFRVILLESNTHTYILSSGECPRVKPINRANINTQTYTKSETQEYRILY